MKDDALPQNPGMCLPYACGQRCHYMLRMCVHSHGLFFFMHINAVQNIKQVLRDQSGLAFSETSQ